MTCGKRVNMNDYCNGIAYATGYFAKENGGRFLVVRNLDAWYAKTIEAESRYKAYESKHNIGRDGRPQWNIKARDINSIPSLDEIQCVSDFCRAYIEIHGLLDLASVKDRKGNCYKKPRLRIYGKGKILSFINGCLPATEKKIQYINNAVEEGCVGRTCALYYQSAKEIAGILQWLDGSPRSEQIWEKWNEMIGVY